MSTNLPNNLFSAEELLTLYFSKQSALIQTRQGNTCYSYDRVSSKNQMVNGNSLVWQYENIDAFAEKNCYTIKKRYGGTYESAQSDERKEFKRMIADISKDKSVSAIIVYAYDRFSRSGANGIFLLENLRKLGVRIISITQKVESFTPTGNFQENLYMLLSKLDNDMRREKSVAGTKSMLLRGYWPYSTPVGYTNLNKNSTADKHQYVLNETGVLLGKAFDWKASGKFSNQQIIDKLKLKGLTVRLKYMAWIFANPFYCGYIASSLIPGEMVKGHHPALINMDTFLLVNNISRQNPRSGVPRHSENEELPLKIFFKDIISKSPFTGYYHKQKGLYYYKSRDKGTQVNVSAKLLNKEFEAILTQFEYKKQHSAALKVLLNEKLKSHLAGEQVDEKNNKKRITELKNQLELMEERFVLAKISKEQYDKFSNKFKEEIFQLQQEMDQHQQLSSNLSLAVEKGLKIAENISQLWAAADYRDKQKLQYLVFPDGMSYDKKNKVVLTEKVNTLFSEIALQQRVLDKNEKDNLFKDCLLSNSVGWTRFELATPSTPC